MNLQEYREHYGMERLKELCSKTDPPMAVPYLYHVLAGRQNVSPALARNLVKVSRLEDNPGERLTLSKLRPDIWGPIY